MRQTISVTLLLGVIVALSFGATALVPKRTAKTHYYDSEFVKTVKGGVPVLNVTIYERIANDKVAKLLRSELEVVIEAFEPTEDILATAWDENEDQILPRDETFIYVAKDKRIMLWKEYEIRRK